MRRPTRCCSRGPSPRRPRPRCCSGTASARSARSPALQPFARTLGWVAPSTCAVKAVGVDTWADTATAIADEFARRAPDELSLTAPTDLLRQQHERALTSTQRFGLLGATGSVLLLGAAVVGGAALRRDHEAFTGALRRRGAAPRLLRGLLVGEVLGAAVAGLVAGCILGAAGAAVVAARGGLPVLATAGVGRARRPAGRGGPDPRRRRPARRHRCAPGRPRRRRHPRRLARGRGGRPRCASPWPPSSPLEGASPQAATAQAATARAAARAAPRTPSCSRCPSSSSPPRRWCWPGSGCPSCAAASGLVPRRSVAARLGLAAVTGRPLRPAATAALLTAAVATSVFAGAYQATLDRGATDQAAFAVPLDARVQTGPSLVRPYDAAAPSTLASALPGVTRGPSCASRPPAASSSDQGTAVQLVGLPPDTLPGMTAWADTTGGPDPARLAEALRVGPLPQGTALPAGRRLRIATPGPAANLAVTATLRAAEGTSRTWSCGRARRRRAAPQVWKGPVRARPGRLPARVPAWSP